MVAVKKTCRTRTDLNGPLVYAVETAAKSGSFSPFRPINAVKSCQRTFAGA